MSDSGYRVINGCPCNKELAPYAALILRKAGQQANSIDRSTRPAVEKILKAHGKHTQAEEFRIEPPGVANRPGRSTHERLSDGVAYPHIPVGHPLEDWQQGIDSGQNTKHDRDAIERAARELGFEVFHPYATGVELHHWNFRRRPRPRSLAQRLQIIHLRATLPRS